VEARSGGNKTQTTDISGIPSGKIYGYLKLNIIYIMRSMRIRAVRAGCSRLRWLPRQNACVGLRWNVA